MSQNHTFTSETAKAARAKQPSTKGRQHHLTTTFKEAIAVAYSGIGGHEAFTAWAKDNQTEFYKIAARLIPTELVGTGDDGEHVLRIIHDAR